MSSCRKPNVDEAAYMWFTQQRAKNVRVKGIDLQAAAVCLAEELGVTDFKGSAGWLGKFQERHGLTSRKFLGEAASADTSSVNSANNELWTLVNDTNLQGFQLYWV
jgi:hypothetical protein